MLNDPLLNHIFIALLILVGAGIVGQMLRLFLTKVAGTILKLTRTTLDDRIVEVIRSRVRGLFLIWGGFEAGREIREGLTSDHVIHHKILDYVDIALYLLLVLILFRIAGKISTAVLEWYMDEGSSKMNNPVTPTVIPMASKIISLVLIIIAFLIILDHFGINIGSLLVSLGVGSLALALAAQETVANMISGFVILIDQPFRVGDRIRLPSGEVGDVMSIGLRSVRILNFENNLIVASNTELVKNTVINFSFPNESMRVIVDLGVAYGTDIEKARQIILSLASRQPEIESVPPPQVVLTQLGESAIQLRLIARATDFSKRYNAEAHLREQIYNAFKAAGIEFPFPQRTVRIVNSNEPPAHQTK